MKKLLVVFLAVAMLFSFAATAMAADVQLPDYTDMADQKVEWQAAVYRLTALGVLEGNTGVGGDFRPGEYLTRAELAKIAVYLTNNVDKVEYYAAQAPAYTDVVDGAWYEGYVNACKDLGLMKGIGYGQFNPAGTVTFQETATVVLRALGYTDALKGDWPQDYSRKAGEVGLIDYVEYVGPKAITRAELASIFNEALDKFMVSYIADSTAQGIGQILALSAYEMFLYDIDDVDKDKWYGVDGDGFAYNMFYTNEKINHRTTYNTLLAYAFDADFNKVQFFDGIRTDGHFKDDEVSCFSEANGWGYDDFDDGELLLAYAKGAYKSAEPKFADIDLTEVASLYYILGGDLVDLGNMQAEVTTNDDGEVLFVYITSTKVQVVKPGSNGQVSGSLKKIDLGEETYKVNKEGGYQFVDSAFDKDEVDPGYFGYAFINKDGEVYDYKQYSQFDDEDVWVIKEVTDTKVTFLNESGNEVIENLDDFVVWKDGEFIEIGDLERGDVVYHDKLVDEDVTIYLAYAPVEGGSLTKGYTDENFGFIMDEVRYYGVEGYSWYSTNAGDTFVDYDEDFDIKDEREEFFEEEVTYAAAYAFKNFVYIQIDIESYNYGVLTKFNYEPYTQEDNQLKSVTIFMADGEKVEYALEDNFYNNNIVDNEEFWTLGSFVEFDLNKDGEIATYDAGATYGDVPEMWFKENGEDIDAINITNEAFASRLVPLNADLVEGNIKVKVEDDDQTIEIVNQDLGGGNVQDLPYTGVYDLADDVEIFSVTTKGSGDNIDDPKLYDKVKMIKLEDFLADGDFICEQIAFCYTSDGGFQIDTLWIVDSNVEDDIKVGFIEQSSKYDKDDYYIMIDGKDIKAKKAVYDRDLDGYIVAYSLEGDVVTGVDILAQVGKKLNTVEEVEVEDPDDNTQTIDIDNPFLGEGAVLLMQTADIVGGLTDDEDASSIFEHDLNEFGFLSVLNPDDEEVGPVQAELEDALNHFHLTDADATAYTFHVGIVEAITDGSIKLVPTFFRWEETANSTSFKLAKEVFFKDYSINNDYKKIGQIAPKNGVIVFVVAKGNTAEAVFVLATGATEGH